MTYAESLSFQERSRIVRRALAVVYTTARLSGEGMKMAKRFTVTCTKLFTATDIGTADYYADAIAIAQRAEVVCNIFEGLFTVVAWVEADGTVHECNVQSGAVHL